MERIDAGRGFAAGVALAVAMTVSACAKPRLPAGGVPRPPASPAGLDGQCEPGMYVDEAFADLREETLAYSRVVDRFGEHDLKLDVYRPREEPAVPRPAIVWLFGGNFLSGDRRQLREFARAFASRGYVTAAIDYRLLHGRGASTLEAAEAAQSDAQAAIRFLRLRAGDLALDPDRIAIAGFSAGSITAFNVAYRGEFLGDDMENPGVPHDVGAVVGLDGFSAYDDIQAGDPPFILFRAAVAARDDGGALPRLLASAEAAGVPHEVQVVRRARHQDLIQRPHSRAIVLRAAAFLRRHFACR